MEQDSEQTWSNLEQSLIMGLARVLVQGRGMNDFLHNFLSVIGKAFSAARLALYDHDEYSGEIELLYFSGYGPGARWELSHRLQTLGIDKALQQREPFWARNHDGCLLIPLYFQETLEAVLMLEIEERGPEIDELCSGTYRVISRFLGLFMSSLRLPINQRRGSAQIPDLQRAREVQMTYLPTDYPVSEHFEIYGYNQSSALVGGDYFDYFRLRENSIQCVVADACGHGMAAALIMSTFRGMLHSEVHNVNDFHSLFDRMNQRLYSGGELVQYLTGIFVDYSEDLQELRYFNAGHFDPLILHNDGTASPLPGGGPPLGMFEGSCYEVGRVNVRQGDLLVLFTDGLVELRNEREEFFEVEGILRAISARKHYPLRDLAREVLAEAAGFSASPRPDDDLTLFLMRFQ